MHEITVIQTLIGFVVITGWLWTVSDDFLAFVQAQFELLKNFGQRFEDINAQLERTDRSLREQRSVFLVEIDELKRQISELKLELASKNQEL